MSGFDISDFIGSSAIPQNAVDFNRSLLALADYVDGSVKKVIRKACIDLYRKIVERTPVDTGRAKASWGLSIYADDSSTAPEHPDGFSFNEISDYINSEIEGFDISIHDGVIFIYNNLEYIEFLENGSSEQAPFGMVALSLAEFENHFNNELSKLEAFS